MRRGDLDEPIQDLILSEGAVGRGLVLNALRKIATICILHDNTQTAILDEVLHHAHDVGVVSKLSEHCTLVHGLGTLLFAELLEGKLLHHVLERVGLPPHEISRSKGASPKNLHDRVTLELAVGATA